MTPGGKLRRADIKTAEALNAPFLLLPFRPDSDASGGRVFIRNFYKYNAEGSHQYRGTHLQQELRLTEPIVLCSVMKWCWSRMPGGVVTWPVYEGFQIGERESNMARNAFNTFIPISAESPARRNIIYDFFDLVAAVAAHGKLNGLGGRKLSRLAGWWAFEHSDDGKGFEGGYRSWSTAAEASSHLFFAYLRSLSPEADPSMSVIERIPRSLQALLASTEYPPETPTLLQRSTPRVVMMVDSVSPTPFALLRRAKHFEYRHNDRVLREYSEFDDPLEALTYECKRVLYAISTTNSQAAASRRGNMAKTQESWSNFSNLGFSDYDERALQKTPNGMNGVAKSGQQGLRSQARSRNADHGRPTTPSWADFLSSGFNEDDLNAPKAFVLPPDKMLPPINSRAQTPSHALSDIGDENLAPGELAAITNVELDDAFWWVWMTSLAGEEPAERKAVFGRCALIETTIMNGRWLIMEEQVKGASPDPTEGVYVAPKKSSIFSFTKRGRNKKSKPERSTPTPTDQLERATSATPSKASLAPDQQTRIKVAAAALARKERANEGDGAYRRGRYDDAASTKTSSMLTMGMMNEASPAMKWAHAYDKNETRSQYLGNDFAGKGVSREDLVRKTSSVNMNGDGMNTPKAPALSPEATSFPVNHQPERELPALPQEQPTTAGASRTEPAYFDEEPATEEPSDLHAMHPKGPDVNVFPADPEELQDEAEHVPLPETAQTEPSINPLDKELGVSTPSSLTRDRLSRKPVPRSEKMQDHPAFRQRSDDEPALQATSGPVPMTLQADSPLEEVPQTPQSPTNPAAIAAQRAMGIKQEQTSPESQKGLGQGKLKKQGGGGGLKKLFGRKKDKKNRQSMEVEPRPGSNSLAPPSESNLGRRLSLMRKKPANRDARVGTVPNGSHAAIDQFQEEPESAQEPTMPSSPPQYEANDMSRVGTREDANPDHEFSRFDQGPMEDMPIAEPQESHEELEQQHHDLPAPAPQRHFNTQLAGRIAPVEHDSGDNDGFVTPMERGDPTNDAQSETTMEDPQEDSLPAKDRWAQIRENAAKRAARASEEQSTQSRPSQSMRETDDGETSGEESKSRYLLSSYKASH